MLALTALTLSCMAPAQKVLQGTNEKVKVELLFEVDGCKVYRFYDGPEARGNARYFTKCQDSNSSVGWLQPCGDDCQYYEENITTYEKNEGE